MPELEDKEVKSMSALPDGPGEIFLTEDPLEYIVKYVSKRVKHEETLIKLSTIVMVSAYTPNPLNIALESPQSEGKSYSLVEVSKIFPRNDVWDLGGMTPKVLTREKGYLVDKETGINIDKDIKDLKDSISVLGNSEEDKEKRKELRSELHDLMKNSVKIVDMSGKILLFLEAPKTDTFSILRPILSRDKYEVEYKFVDRAYKNGPLVTMEARIRGWPVAVYASADAPKGNIWDQIRSRFIIVSPNMTKKKYKAANQYTASKYGSISIPSKLEKENKELQQCRDYINAIKSVLYSKFKDLSTKNYYKPENVSFTWNPMAYDLEKSFPSTKGQNMRDFKYFMSLMEVSCLFSLFNRPYFEVEGHPQWVVTKWDLKIVTEVFDTYHFFIKIGELPIKIFESLILKMDLNHETVDEEDGFTKKDIRKAIGDAGYPSSDRYIKDNILDPLEEIGLLSVNKSKGDQRVNIYVPFRQKYQNLLENSFLKIKYGPNEFKKGFKPFKNICTGFRSKYMNSSNCDVEEDEFISNKFFSDQIFYSPLNRFKSENNHENESKCKHSNKSRHSEGKEVKNEEIKLSLNYDDMDDKELFELGNIGDEKAYNTLERRVLNKKDRKRSGVGL